MKSAQLFVNLLYHIDRLCVSSTVVSNVFKIAHSDEYSEFDRCYDIISKTFYVKNLIKHLRSYIRNCSDCLILQTRRHRSYEFLQSIMFLAMSYHIISIDFILALFVIVEEFDIILSVIDKFIKKITLSSEKVIYKTVD